MVKMYRLYKITDSNERIFAGDFDSESRMERYILNNSQFYMYEYEMTIVYIPNPITL